MTAPRAPYLRSAELLSRGDSRLLIVDVQEKLVPKIASAARMVGNCRRLIQGAKLLSVPVFVTEQYPRGLGRTVRELAELLPQPPEKSRFSCAEVLDWGLAGEQPDQRHKIVVAGIETHVCVMQTALDLIAAGFQVYVPADAVGSRRELDWKIALDRLASSGAVIVTTESVLFEWCEVSGTPEFKQVIDLVKDEVPS